MRFNRGKGVLISLTGLLLVAGVLVGATTASADSIQVQSYQRSSQSQACTAQPGETPWQASWGSDSSWHPSWEQWANGGQGGWTCTRSITWARDSATAAVTYRLGDIGPGGGLVFLIHNGVRYEMAPSSWGAGENGLSWCDDSFGQPGTNVPGTAGSAVGTGASNTAALAASTACGSDAAAAVLGFAGTDASAGQWFLPSKDELNAMCNYSRNPTSPAAPNVPCYGSSGSTQNPAFASSAFGFGGLGEYWSSTQLDDDYSWWQYFGTGDATIDFKYTADQVRPIRAF